MILLWYRTDLRIEDNPAVERAVAVAESRGMTIQPVFVFDPQFYGEASLACDARIEFMHECLRSLREQYRERASETFVHELDSCVARERFLTVELRIEDEHRLDGRPLRLGHRDSSFNYRVILDPEVGTMPEENHVSTR